MKQLREKMKEMKVKRTASMKKKADLQIALFSLILRRQLSLEDHASPEDVSGGATTQSKREPMCWNRGNWLSYMANISSQIDYLGPLGLIW